MPLRAAYKLISGPTSKAHTAVRVAPAFSAATSFAGKLAQTVTASEPNINLKDLCATLDASAELLGQIQMAREAQPDICSAGQLDQAARRLAQCKQLLTALSMDTQHDPSSSSMLLQRVVDLGTARIAVDAGKIWQMAIEVQTTLLTIQNAIWENEQREVPPNPAWCI
ncbi:uncharacterized protein PHACADRAFT_265618 [Phanerochaete carnosa HHB-10118-sp]|uniref:Uncharacterized protein n=1 Tax=Phanerochaete carnosa (strain HHB-10118-sp) TaxID=650164 RepID=K5WI34_PHACS|nr:uncharacterized protein PHACADRAFT_265618 [Phanerochaete carnosa HHB-10118-sp]EKM49872.1 hypothetical protein PHACADRAFT_265618 [Phanerochaete carnosa HHB-10118-sp]